VQAIGLIVLRIPAADLPRPAFACWLYPIPALSRQSGFGGLHVLVYRTNSMKQIRYALVILNFWRDHLLRRAAWRNRRVAFCSNGGPIESPAPRPCHAGHRTNDAWAPLREPLFRSLWIAIL